MTRCEAKYRAPTWADSVRCVNQEHLETVMHQAYHPYRSAFVFGFSEEQAMYPKPAGAPIEDCPPVAGQKITSQLLRGYTAPASEKQVGGEHYRETAIQPWDIIDDHDLDFYRGNALKYLLRAGKKGSAVQDLRKAIHYIEKCIEKEG